MWRACGLKLANPAVCIVKENPFLQTCFVCDKGLKHQQVLVIALEPNHVYYWTKIPQKAFQFFKELSWPT
jgi:hypothetical protein